MNARMMVEARFRPILSALGQSQMDFKLVEGNPFAIDLPYNIRLSVQRSGGVNFQRLGREYGPLLPDERTWDDAMEELGINDVVAREACDLRKRDARARRCAS